MFEREWEESTNVRDLLNYLYHTRAVHQTGTGRRLLRLYGCASCRRVWHLVPDGACRRAVELAEAYADGQAAKAVLRKALKAAAPFLHAGPGAVNRSAVQAVFYAAAPDALRVTQAGPFASAALHDGGTTDDGDFCHRLRDMFGNPFRPVGLDPAWRTPTVTALAVGIYEQRAFDRMPILADALQEAGCENEDVLDHCRGDGPHARGCWVVDAILGKR